MLDAVSIADDVLAAHPTTVSIHRIVLQLLAEKVRLSPMIQREDMLTPTPLRSSPSSTDSKNLPI